MHLHYQPLTLPSSLVDSTLLRYANTSLQTTTDAGPSSSPAGQQLVGLVLPKD
ncbi:unnamed protein product [Protopolystoma xenopodis]|uniref:Uncharacterized protein n=1 Tax=Protopolystoma xenopodis TaxID=117903 RepID=A0A448XFZ5_9PLAT|nr:unnamed protein product [Protopolystoma xenopodis]